MINYYMVKDSRNGDLCCKRIVRGWKPKIDFIRQLYEDVKRDKEGEVTVWELDRNSEPIKKIATYKANRFKSNYWPDVGYSTRYVNVSDPERNLRGLCDVSVKKYKDYSDRGHIWESWLGDMICRTCGKEIGEVGYCSSYKYPYDFLVRIAIYEQGEVDENGYCYCRGCANKTDEIAKPEGDWVAPNKEPM